MKDSVHTTYCHQIYGAAWRFWRATNLANKNLSSERKDPVRESECRTGYFHLRTGEYISLCDDDWIVDRFEEDDVVLAINSVLRHDLHGESIDHLSPEWVDAFHVAHRIAMTATTRLLVDAMILSACDISTIAEKVKLSPSHVLEYERCFFDIRPYLGASVFIVSMIDRSCGELDSLRGFVLKLSYYGGPDAAAHCLDHIEFIGKGIDHDLTTPHGCERERLELILLEASIDPSKASPTILAEMSRQSPPVLRSSTVSEAVNDQIMRTLHRREAEQTVTLPVAYLDPLLPQRTVYRIA